jgi:hypothetical protein
MSEYNPDRPGNEGVTWRLIGAAAAMFLLFAGMMIAGSGHRTQTASTDRTQVTQPASMGSEPAPIPRKQ